MSTFEVSTGKLRGIFVGVGKICPYLPGIGLKTTSTSPTSAPTTPTVLTTSQYRGTTTTMSTLTPLLTLLASTPAAAPMNPTPNDDLISR